MVCGASHCSSSSGLCRWSRWSLCIHQEAQFREVVWRAALQRLELSERFPSCFLSSGLNGTLEALRLLGGGVLPPSLPFFGCTKLQVLGGENFFSGGEVFFRDVRCREGVPPRGGDRSVTARPFHAALRQFCLVCFHMPTSDQLVLKFSKFLFSPKSFCYWES